MTMIDDVKTDIPEGTYLGMCNLMKTLHEEREEAPRGSDFDVGGVVRGLIEDQITANATRVNIRNQILSRQCTELRELATEAAATIRTLRDMNAMQAKDIDILRTGLSESAYIARKLNDEVKTLRKFRGTYPKIDKDKKSYPKIDEYETDSEDENDFPMEVKALAKKNRSLAKGKVKCDKCDCVVAKSYLKKHQATKKCEKLSKIKERYEGEYGW